MRYCEGELRVNEILRGRVEGREGEGEMVNERF